jgi:hypothetical protein
MPTLDARIDDLYRQPLGGFVAARQALAKTLTGDDRRKVAALRKPLAIPWAINQTYWNARPVYDQLLSAGEKLRAAQVGALKGRNTDVRSATAQHAEALNHAVAAADRISREAGLSPQPDAMRRMFEAISTRASLPAPHGRFVESLEPASGFEALAGIPIAAPRPGSKATPASTGKTGVAIESPAEKPAGKAGTRPQERERVEAERRRRTAIKTAEQKAKRAAEAVARAKTEWERAKRELDEADRALADLLADET